MGGGGKGKGGGKGFAEVDKGGGRWIGGEGTGMPRIRIPPGIDPGVGDWMCPNPDCTNWNWAKRGECNKCLSLIHISEPTRLLSISYAVFCLKKKKTTKQSFNSTEKRNLYESLKHTNVIENYE
eukprot:TRINITY_DN39366_c0_g1_i1.p2 TRINITY_DN39366_c0_g1~~TRINITY_DN39366_c0_g1_i1.p2  ORF type:complete len:124 (+),score=24.85 TRINITY_DN39366_c0_g1_i1:214-585(+)